MNLGWHDAKTQALLHAFPGAQLHALQQAYAEPPRAYHNWQHVLELLRHYSYVEAECGWHKPRAVLLAMLYHDAIYVPGRKDNEAHSAQLALAHLTQWPDEGIDPQRVHGLILATAHHGQHAPAIFILHGCNHVQGNGVRVSTHPKRRLFLKFFLKFSKFAFHCVLEPSYTYQHLLRLLVSASNTLLAVQDIL